jgi:hypothetical protein
MGSKQWKSLIEFPTEIEVSVVIKEECLNKEKNRQHCQTRSANEKYSFGELLDSVPIFLA